MSKKMHILTDKLIKAFFNYVKKLINLHPVFFTIVFLLLVFVFYHALMSSDRMIYFLSFLVSTFSILLYSKNRSYAETLMSFMIGTLTVFTIKWNETNSLIFIIFYIVINVLIFYISAARLSTKVEKELTIAATYISTRNHKSIYSKLDIVCKRGGVGLLSTTERAIVIKQLAFQRVPLIDIENGVKLVENIVTIFDLNLEEGCDYFYSLYFISSKMYRYEISSLLLDKIVNCGLSVRPIDFCFILNKTKKYIVRNKLDFDIYLSEIKNLLEEGGDKEQIVSSFIQLFDTK